MKIVLMSILTGALFISSVSAEVVSFDDSAVGNPPEGWIAGSTGGENPRWVVETDSSATSKPNVLKQTGEGNFPWCVKKDVKLKDGFVEVKFKPISGKEDQAGGLVWRWKDGNNYYVTRANALEDNVTIYHTLKGKREAFKSVDVKVTSNEWHTLRIDFKGNHFVVTFDGKVVLEEDDDSIAGTGAVGVWTKADSVTAFDDFRFE